MTASKQAGAGEFRRLSILLVRWILPIAILGWFVLSGHLMNAVAALGDVSPGWAALLVVVGVSLPLSHAWRWCYLLNRIDLRIPLAGSARVTSLASLVNYAAPGFLGAPAKAVLARDRYQIPVSRSLPTLAVEQALDAFMLLAAATLSVLITGTAVLEVVNNGSTAGEVVTAAVLLITIALVAAAGWFVGQRLLPGFFDSLRNATGTLLRSRIGRRPILALTGARWALDMSAVGIASVAVGLRLGVLEILLLANLSLLAGLLAPVPGGLGVREAVMASIAGVLGVSIPAILALSILHRAGLGLGLPLVLAGARAVEWRSR